MRVCESGCCRLHVAALYGRAPHKPIGDGWHGALRRRLAARKKTRTRRKGENRESRKLCCRTKLVEHTCLSWSLSFSYSPESTIPTVTHTWGWAPWVEGPLPLHSLNPLRVGPGCNKGHHIFSAYIVSVLETSLENHFYGYSSLQSHTSYCNVWPCIFYLYLY